MPTMLARPPHEYYITKQPPHTSSSNRISDLAFSFACALQFVHFNVTASHLLGNGFARRHFDVWFELAKNIALRLWRYEMQNLPKIQDQRVRNHQVVIDCWASANPRGCFNDLCFIHTATGREKSIFALWLSVNIFIFVKWHINSGCLRLLANYKSMPRKSCPTCLIWNMPSTS